MKVHLLGTTSADGGPNPFCRCASCEDLRQNGVVRAQSSALIDELPLLKCGPDLPRSSGCHQVRLNDVERLVVTHGHWYHCSGIPLLMRVPPLAEDEAFGNLGMLPWITGRGAYVFSANDVEPSSEESWGELYRPRPDHLNPSTQSLQEKNYSNGCEITIRW